MVRQRVKNQPKTASYISGWRLWLSIISVVVSLSLLSQADRFGWLEKRPDATFSWTITASGSLTAVQQCEVERRLLMVIKELPKSPELRYSLRPISGKTTNAALNTIDE